MIDAELLAEVATLDEVEARIPTHAEQIKGIVPEWCELILEVKREPDMDADISLRDSINTRMHLRRHDGELIGQVIADVLHPETDRLARESIWDELDKVVDRIQRRVDRGAAPMKTDVGMARGLSLALALLDSTREPDVDEVKGVAMERYAIRHGISGVDDDE